MQSNSKQGLSPNIPLRPLHKINRQLLYQIYSKRLAAFLFSLSKYYNFILMLMPMYVKAIQNAFQSQTKNQPSEVQTLTIRHIEFQKIQPETKLLLQTYSRLAYLQFENCDLRTLNNFPNLQTLIELRLSHNKLQGSLQNIIKLMGLQYLDISHNIIKDVSKLTPLKRIKKLTLCASNNPFENKDGWKSALNSLNLKIEKESKKHPLQVHEQEPTVFNLKKEEHNPFQNHRETIRQRLDLLDFERALLNKKLKRIKQQYGHDLKIQECLNVEEPNQITQRIRRLGRPKNMDRKNIMKQSFSNNRFEPILKFQENHFNSESLLGDDIVVAGQISNSYQQSLNSFIDRDSQSSLSDNGGQQLNQGQENSSQNYNDLYHLEGQLDDDNENENDIQNQNENDNDNIELDNYGEIQDDRFDQSDDSEEPNFDLQL